jgi:hypothetical protein
MARKITAILEQDGECVSKKTLESLNHSDLINIISFSINSYERGEKKDEKDKNGKPIYNFYPTTWRVRVTLSPDDRKK